MWQKVNETCFLSAEDGTSDKKKLNQHVCYLQKIAKVTEVNADVCYLHNIEEKG